MRVLGSTAAAEHGGEARVARPTPAYPRSVARTEDPDQARPVPAAPLRAAPPTPVRAAGVLVGVQALGAAAFTAALVVRAGSTPVGVGPVLAEAGFFLLVAVALGTVAVGLLTGRDWARTPALVTQLLLLPVAYSLVGPSRQVVLGLAVGVLVFAAFMLLINERSRLWSMGVDPDDPEAR
jgi:hypothetical protein